MWGWLGTQAQSASPFVAVFCLTMLALAGVVIKKLWNQHLEDQRQRTVDNTTLLAVSKASIEANSAVALAIERSTSTTILAIAGLKEQLGGRRTR